jgi:hypothetical protein
MPFFTVACIVEGRGEEAAVPILVRRIVLLVNSNLWADVRAPIKQHRGTLLSEGGLEKAVELAIRGLPEPGMVLVIIDSDDDCPKTLAPLLLARAERVAASRRPVAVVLAHREFECWFIAAAKSLAGHSGLPPDLIAPPDPESIRGAKEWLRRNMAVGRTYSPAIDQPALTNRFDIEAARAAPSFDKLYREIERFCALVSSNDPA